MFQDTALNTLKYWHMEEFLLPQEVDSPAKMKRTNKKLFVEKGDFKTIINATKMKIDENNSYPNAEYKWEFTFYGGMFKVDNIREIIEKVIPSTKFSGFEERPPTGYAASYSLSFSSTGKYKIDSLQVSTAPWAIKNIVQEKKFPFLSYDEFQLILKEVNEKLDLISSDEKISSIKDFILASGSPIKDIVGDDLLDKTKEAVFQVVGVKRKQEDTTSVNDSDFLKQFLPS